MSCSFVGNPAVNATTTAEHPQDVLEAEIVAQRLVENLTGDGHELPAFAADVGLVAARSHLIVVGHVDVEDEFTLHRLHVGIGAVILRTNQQDGTDVDFEWIS